MCVLLLGFGGCAKPGTTPSGTPSRTAGSTPTAPQADPNAAPTDPPGGERFGFDQAARFGDGMLVQVSTIKSAKASPQQHGAEGTDANMVVAEILVTNSTSGPLPTEPIKVYGYYFTDVGAPKIIDPTGALGNSFQGTLQPGEQAKATMGFAIPADAMGDVTIMIDGGTGDHGPVQFSGAVS